MLGIGVGVVLGVAITVNVTRVVCGVCEVGRGAMFGEQCLLLRSRCVSDVNFWRAAASAFAPSAPILLPDRCAVVVVGAGPR